MLYKDYYRKHGATRYQYLINPKIVDWGKLTFPRESIYHYLPHDDVEKGISPHEPIIAFYEDNIVIEHISDLATEQGNPRAVPFNVKNEMRTYHRRYRKLKLNRNIKTTLRDKSTLLVVDYCFISHRYTYKRVALSDYNEWFNLQNTLWNESNQLVGITDRQQFITFELPETLPSLSELRKAADKKTKTTLTPFGSDEHFTLLDLWCWLSKAESGSTLDTIDPEALSQINIILVESDKWMMFNLGYIQAWVEEDNISPDKLSLDWYKGVLKLFQTRTAMSGDGETISELDLEVVKKSKKRHIEDSSDVESVIKDQAVELAELGLLSSAEVKRAEKMATKYKDIAAPDGEGKLSEYIASAGEFAKVEDTKLVRDLDTVFDKTMLNSSLTKLDKTYIESGLERDVAAMPMNLQRMGVAVTDFKVKEYKDAMNNKLEYSVQLTPLRGKPVTIKYQLPAVQEDGTFIADGVRSRLNRQRVDGPIRKTLPVRVALTSYYGKTFVTRSEKAVNDYGKWLAKKIIVTGIDTQDETITSLGLGDGLYTGTKLPRLYTGLSRHISTFKHKQYTFSFHYLKREELYGKEKVAKVEKSGEVVCGKHGTSLITMDMNGDLHLHGTKGKEALGQLTDVLPLDFKSSPVEMCEMKVLGKTLPVGIILSYWLGLNELIKRLGIKTRTISKGTRAELGSDEVAIKFKDETLIFSRNDHTASLILGGFQSYHRQIKQYNLTDFDQNDVYYNVLESTGLHVRYLRELDLIEAMFIDPITLKLLEQIKEPTSMVNLVIRAVELLTVDEHPEEASMEGMRLRGYERMAGAVYGELVDSMRAYNNAPITANSQIDVNPNAVWLRIISDPATKIVEDTNPIHNLREKELVTYMGDGGRAAQTMVRSTRRYHKTNMGVISEATVDSGKVAINSYTSADPKIVNANGLTERYDKSKDSPTNLMSTSALLTPSSDRDDNKRVNFIHIQHGHGVACNGYSVTPLRTGYEQVIAHRTDKMYSYPATDSGVVKSVTDDVLELEVGKDKTKVLVEIGVIQGVVSGEYIPHEMITDLKPGDKFKAGDILAFHSGWFERDIFDKTQVAWKAGTMATTVFIEGNDTWEDGSAISAKMSEKLITPVSKVRSIMVPFDTEVYNLVEAGDKLTGTDVLCIMDGGFTDVGKLDTDVIESLKNVSRVTPRAKDNGTVERIEVFYRGDIAEMTESLQDIVKRYDRERAKKSKRLGRKDATTGYVRDNVHIDGEPLVENSVCIKIYMVGELEAGGGDKLVLSSQLKTVPGRVMYGTNKTEHGDDIDIVYSWQGVANRIVNSPVINGTTNRLLKLIGMEAIRRYRGD